MNFKIGLFSVVAFCCFGVATTAQRVIKSGTPVRVKLDQTVQSAIIISSGGGVVASDVADEDGNVLIKWGTPVELNVARLPAKAWGRPGEIKIDAVSTTATDGSLVPLSGGYYQMGQDRRTEAWLVALGGCVLVPLVGIVAGLFVTGENVIVPYDYTLPSVKVTNDVNLKK